MEGKYPPSLFFTGVLVSMARHLFLAVPAAFCLIAGIWSRPLRLAGLICLVADLVYSVIEQLLFMNVMLNSDDDEDFDKFRKAMLDKNWRENIKTIMEDTLEDPEAYFDEDDYNDDDPDDDDSGDDYSDPDDLDDN